MRRRATTLVALALGTALSASLALAIPAAAADGPELSASIPNAPAVAVDPQPVVVGHEGDVLLLVSVAMPAATRASTKVPKVGAARHPRRHPSS